jgi:hypothetical protein
MPDRILLSDWRHELYAVRNGKISFDDRWQFDRIVSSLRYGNLQSKSGPKRLSTMYGRKLLLDDGTVGCDGNVFCWVFFTIRCNELYELYSRKLLRYFRTFGSYRDLCCWVIRTCRSDKLHNMSDRFLLSDRCHELYAVQYGNLSFDDRWQFDRIVSSLRYGNLQSKSGTKRLSTMHGRKLLRDNGTLGDYVIVFSRNVFTCQRDKLHGMSDRIILSSGCVQLYVVRRQ